MNTHATMAAMPLASRRHRSARKLAPALFLAPAVALLAMFLVYPLLQSFRLSLLDGKIPEALKQPIFCFPEEFRVLQSAILAFAKPLTIRSQRLA